MLRPDPWVWRMATRVLAPRRVLAAPRERVRRRAALTAEAGRKLWNKLAFSPLCSNRYVPSPWL